MAAELGSAELSWTFRSKICEPDGELNRGDDGWPARPGDEGVIGGTLVTLTGEGAGCRVAVSGSTRGVDVGAELELPRVGRLSSLSSFFLPSPKSPRFLDLPSADTDDEAASMVESDVSSADCFDGTNVGVLSPTPCDEVTGVALMAGV